MSSTKNQDEIDTARVVMQANTRVEFQSTTVEPGVSTQLEIVPQEPMENPTLFMSQDPGDDAEVVEVVVGQIVLAVAGHVSNYKFGCPIKEIITRKKTLKILLRSDRLTRVGASLVVSEKPGTYRISDRKLLNEG